MRLLVLLALVGFATPSRAQHELTWHVSTDNDYFNFWVPPDSRPDFGYTHGSELSVHAPTITGVVRWLAPPWLVGSDRDGRAHLVMNLRQEIYTPWRRAGDQPYAGWLEVGLGVRCESPRSLRRVQLHLGVTGPPSLAEPTQKWVHRMFGFGEPHDWSKQLPFEPGLILEYESARQPLGSGRPEGLRWSAGPWWRARLGTVVDDVSGGGQVALGLRPLVPWRASDQRAQTGVSAYLTGAARVDVVVRNEFLDGTLFRASRGVAKYPVVPEAEYGIALGYRRLRVEWRVMRRAKDFRTQPMPHTLSSLVIALVGGPPVGER